MTITVARAFSRRHRSEPTYDVQVEWPDNKQLVGIEIEAELRLGGGEKRAIFPVANTLSFWNVINDGSLVGGKEFKLIQPLSGSRLAAAIYELFNGETRFYRSVSSGTHIHINMDEETTPLGAVQSLVALVYAIEPAIYGMADPGRKWGGFTNPLDSANSRLFNVLLNEELSNDFSPLVALCSSNHEYKYFGLNIQTLGSYGSMEFRYFPTAVNVDEVVDWVSLVQSLKMAAVATPHLAGMVETLKNEDAYVALLSTFLGRWAERILSYVPPAVARRRVNQMMAKYAAGRVRSTGIPQPYVSEQNKYSKFFKKRSAFEAPEERGQDGTEVARPTAASSPHTSFAYDLLMTHRQSGIRVYHRPSLVDGTAVPDYPVGSLLLVGRGGGGVMVLYLIAEHGREEIVRFNHGAHSLRSSNRLRILLGTDLEHVGAILSMISVHPLLSSYAVQINRIIRELNTLVNAPVPDHTF